MSNGTPNPAESQEVRELSMPSSGDPGKVLSVNVGVVREVEWKGKARATGIWKYPVAGRIPVRGVNLEGDEQADRHFHGGPRKSVYAYAQEDYLWWEEQLGLAISPGTFGENLTLRGVAIERALIGERWRIGTAALEVTEPRVPCWK
ncbi:MAG: MOSC domain-containing protein, partial [Actinomycetota bacterium]